MGARRGAGRPPPNTPRRPRRAGGGGRGGGAGPWPRPGRAGPGPAGAGQELADRQVQDRGKVGEPLPLGQPDLAVLQARDIALTEGGITTGGHPCRQFLLTPAKFPAAMGDNGAQRARRLLPSYDILKLRSSRGRPVGWIFSRVRVPSAVGLDVRLASVDAHCGAFRVRIGARPTRSG